MTLPTNPDVVENISDLFALFERKWPFPKQVIFRGESKEYDNYWCPSIFRDGQPIAEYEEYQKFYAAYSSGNNKDVMFDRLHTSPHPLSFPFIALAQHYGVKTRFLDVTLNPLVALYFAISSNPEDDGYIFFFIENYLDVSPYNKFHNLDELIKSEAIGNYAPKDDTCLFYRPDWPNARIAAQHGAFVLTKGFSQKIWNGGGIFRIPGHRKPEIMKQLSRFGITRESLFPALHTNY